MNVAPTFDRINFHVSDGTKTMSQEASALGLKPGVVPFGKLYVNSKEVGLWLNTNPILATERLAWLFIHHDRCGGEIQGWRFRPAPETINTNPELEGYDLLIIND